MDFFEQQARARKNSLGLYVLMAMAVACLIFLSCVLLAWWATIGLPESGSALFFWEILPTRVTVMVVAGIVFTVSCASLFEYVKLHQGGAAVAEALGGRLIARTTTDFAEKRVLNIVEEMAIASGVPVPPIYVLDDNSINAFAAGHSIDNAALGVTRGCITELTRDELQGVIAHEFSHIFHGDMTINMRLSALLFGILFVALIGEFLMRSSRYSSNSKNNALPFIGLALFLLGYCGVFFANLIKASVSRQREYLADAAAVQYTRNPTGIAGALNKIARYGSALSHPNAAQFSHMYFANGLSNRFATLFATHPPVKERILRIAPHFRASATVAASTATATPSVTASATAPTHASLINVTGATQRAIESVGQPTHEHLLYAQALIAKLPKTINAALDNPYTARGILLGLFTDSSSGPSNAHWETLPDAIFKDQRAPLQLLADTACSLGSDYRLPLLELAMPRLKQLPMALITELVAAIEHFIHADHSLTLDEWILASLVKWQLLPASRPDGETPSPLHWAIVIGALAQRASTHPAQQAATFTAAMRDLEVRQPLPSTLTITHMDTALAALNQLPIVKKLALLKRASIAIAHDGQINHREIELLRLIALRLDCPMPPLLIRATEIH